MVVDGEGVAVYMMFIGIIAQLVGFCNAGTRDRRITRLQGGFNEGASAGEGGREQRRVNTRLLGIALHRSRCCPLEGTLGSMGAPPTGSKAQYQNYAMSTAQGVFCRVKAGEKVNIHPTVVQVPIGRSRWPKAMLKTNDGKGLNGESK